MDCRDVERLLSPLLDLELEPRDETRARTHLAACEPCGKKWLALQSTRGVVVAAFEADAISPEFDARLERRLARTRRSQVVSRPWLWAAAAALLLALPLLRPRAERPTAPVPRAEASAPRPTPPAAQRQPSPEVPVSAPRTRRPRPAPTTAAASPAELEAPPVAETVEGWPSRLVQPQPVRLALAVSGDEAWRGGRSPELEAFEQRVAAEARKSLLIADSRRDQ